MPRARIALSFLEGGERYNYRVAGIAIRNDHVLVCRQDDDPYVLLPGGRVEFGEDSRGALHREVAEELRVAADVGRLLFTAEDFFTRQGQDFHETGIYYELGLPEDFPFLPGGVCLQTADEGHLLSFEWVPIAPDPLAAIVLLPVWLRSRLGALPGQLTHVVFREEDGQ